ncbi:hypothetical protein GCM10027275_22020 [Rhabdobacter roseus]|uniref:Uncharacterized protein n=1 Tax=Rhabdobacter roseus TaxID=1655419 RepID=A0A840TQZ0_9BACT|nr:hypothetical protein [Rhabdobacter roseus]MBB5284137.1 hypothetical protein [Rhabdobacter roseus]
MKYLFLSLLSLGALAALHAQPAPYRDVPYAQDFSVKYYLPDSTVQLRQVQADRNGVVQVLSSRGLLRPQGGQFQYPGSLQPDRAYLPTADKNVTALGLYQKQLVYLDDQTVFSNAWAGKLYIQHQLPQACFLSAGPDFTFLVSDGSTLRAIRGEQVLWEGKVPQPPLSDLKYDATHHRYLLLSQGVVSSLSLADKKLRTVYQNAALTCFDVADSKIYAGTSKGYQVLGAADFKPQGTLNTKLPCPDLTTVAYAHGHWWFGSSQGTFMLRPDGQYNYYYGERWTPDNQVLQIAEGEGRNLLILTKKGLGEIHFEEMTLHQKALRYEKQVRQRHIRYGFNCDVSTLKNGDLSTLEMGQRDSDNLWTSMYLASQLFRYKVTGEAEALENCLESFEAMQRLFAITGMKGYFARGFERRGYFKTKPTQWDGTYAHGWTAAADPAWDWRGTTSSDQTVGQMFALTLIAEHLDGEPRQKAIALMDELMSTIIENDWYLIDFDGKPTLWGRWNPEYVNGFPTNVGDRKLYASNMIGFLQAAYHFTKKEIYKEKAYELMDKHGYLENLLRPMTQLGPAPATADAHAKELSAEWNHSDDEMYFLAYWCLYPYAFTPELKQKYLAAIREHWDLERPEKNGLWNLCYAMTGAREFDLPETVWHLREFPLDMIEWQVMNSHRQDVEKVPANFRGQTLREVLPPDERPELKHNRNLFKLDRPANGQSTLSPGDTFLLPYWMGRYLGAISAPVDKR